VITGDVCSNNRQRVGDGPDDELAALTALSRAMAQIHHSQAAR
jgi:hypothetical protein